MRVPKKPQTKSNVKNVAFDADAAQTAVNILSHGIAVPAMSYGMYKLGKGVKNTYKQFRSMGRYMRGSK
jgi:hypothetical protein